MTDRNGRHFATPRLRTRIYRWWRIGFRRASEPPHPVDPARLARTEAALVSMPDFTRKVFMMHRFDDLPYRRIAVRTRISIDEVEVHMTTAIILLGRASRGDP